MVKKRAIFFDRDGVINKKPKSHDYIKTWTEFKFMPGVADVISLLNKDFLIIVVSNQRGIARGLMTMDDVTHIHENMKTELNKKRALIDQIYVCPHDDKDACFCRKPKPGMILRAANDFNIDLKNSYFVGDSLTDIEAGKNAGCKTMLLVNSGFIKDRDIEPDFLINDLKEICLKIQGDY